jgi:hypothetical protein
MRLGEINDVAGYGARSQPGIVAGAPAILPDQKIAVSMPGLNIDK